MVRFSEGTQAVVKPKLLVVELWGLGDLVLATPFLQAAAEKYSVTLVAKPYAQELGARFWPEIKVVPFVAPWTAFHHKYSIFRWNWGELLRVRRLHKAHFDVALSGRWDPRDHVVMRVIGAPERIGFSRMGSRIFLTRPLVRPAPDEHRYEYWRALGRALELNVPARDRLPFQGLTKRGREIVLHSGAGQPVRVWPLPRFQRIAEKLRGLGYSVRIICDPDQRSWWHQAGEKDVATPANVKTLIELLEPAGVFIGNDSGPAHLAALLGVPTFTFFGPQLPEWFAPLHPAGAVLEGKPCPYKPCSDYCRFQVPGCLVGVTEADAWPAILRQVERTVGR